MKRATPKITSEFSFPVVYEKGRGGYKVTVPLLPGIVTFGRTMTEAREMAREAIECAV